MLTWLFENDRKKEITKQKFGMLLIERILNDNSIRFSSGIGQSSDAYRGAVTVIDKIKSGEYNDMSEEDIERMENVHEEKLRTSINKIYDIMWDTIKETDPSPEKQCKYVSWIVNRYLNGDIALWEDMGRTQTVLATHYDMVVRKVFKNSDDPSMQALADINKFLDLSSLEAKMREITRANSDMNAADTKFLQNVKSFSDNGQIQILYTSPDNKTLVFIIKTVEASTALFSQRVSWCTAPNGNKHFDHYNKDGPLYAFVFLDSDKYYQLHISSKQFMDKDYRRVMHEQTPITREMWETILTHNDKFVGMSYSLALASLMAPITGTPLRDLISHDGVRDEVVSDLRNKYGDIVDTSKMSDARLINTYLYETGNLHVDIFRIYNEEPFFEPITKHILCKHWKLEKIEHTDFYQLLYNYTKLTRLSDFTNIIDKMKPAPTTGLSDEHPDLLRLVRSSYDNGYGVFENTLDIIDNVTDKMLLYMLLLRNIFSIKPKTGVAYLISWLEGLKDDPNLEKYISHVVKNDNKSMLYKTDYKDFEFAKLEWVRATLGESYKLIMDKFDETHPDMRTAIVNTIDNLDYEGEYEIITQLPDNVKSDLFAVRTSAKKWSEVRDNINKVSPTLVSMFESKIKDEYIVECFEEIDNSDYMISSYNKQSPRNWEELFKDFYKAYNQEFFDMIEYISGDDKQEHTYYMDYELYHMEEYDEIFKKDNGVDIVKALQWEINNDEDLLDSWHEEYDNNVEDSKTIMEFAFNNDIADFRNVVRMTLSRAVNDAIQSYYESRVELFLEQGRLNVMCNVYGGSQIEVPARFMIIGKTGKLIEPDRQNVTDMYNYDNKLTYAVKTKDIIDLSIEQDFDFIIQDDEIIYELAEIEPSDVPHINSDMSDTDEDNVADCWNGQYHEMSFTDGNPHI